MKLGSARIALAATKPALERHYASPRSELRQFGACHNIRAPALSAFDRQLQPEADEITGRSNVLGRHSSQLTRKRTKEEHI